MQARNSFGNQRDVGWFVSFAAVWVGRQKRRVCLQNDRFQRQGLDHFLLLSGVPERDWTTNTDQKVQAVGVARIFQAALERPSRTLLNWPLTMDSH